MYLFFIYFKPGRNADDKKQDDLETLAFTIIYTHEKKEKLKKKKKRKTMEKCIQASVAGRKSRVKHWRCESVRRQLMDFMKSFVRVDQVCSARIE